MMEKSPIGLYFVLEEGQVADLGVVASASLEWDALIKEIAAVIDPSLSVRVELVSGDEGSLWLRSLISAVSAVSGRRPMMVGALTAIVVLFLNTPVQRLADLAWEPIFEALGMSEEDRATISDEDVQRIANQVAEQMRNKTAMAHREAIFRYCERDPAIKGIGAGPSITNKPTVIVPRSEFLERSQGPDTAETLSRKTIWRRDYPVVVIRPFLKAESKRWKFKHGDYEFSATMEDKEFLRAMAFGQTGLELRAGVQMRLDLRVKQEEKDGVWVDKEIYVEKVLSPSQRSQGSLQFPADQKNKSNEQNDK